MGETEALEAIKKGHTTIEGVKFEIKKQVNGWCDGCFYNGNKLVHTCPDLARHICCTGGHILVENKDK